MKAVNLSATPASNRDARSLTCSTWNTWTDSQA